jgi:hypothetical protein
MLATNECSSLFFHHQRRRKKFYVIWCLDGFVGGGLLVLDEALLHEVLVADLHLAIGNIVGDKLGRLKHISLG